MGNRRKCTFNEELQKIYPFIKKTTSDHTVRCNTCSSTFSIENSGKCDIVKHLQTDKHKTAVRSSLLQPSVVNHFRRKVCGETELQLACKEGLFAYHTVRHNHSFASMDCTSKIISKLFESKFTCARTKTEAIIKNVFSPWMQVQLEEDLKQTPFASIYFDSSNHKDIKLVPILVRYFKPSAGVQIKILEFSSLPGETSEILSKYIQDTTAKFDLSQKVISICADNTNTNFGGAKRKGKVNVHKKMETNLGREIVGVGCAAHIIHNAIKSAADVLPIDIESIVGKIYSHFYIYTVRVESLKDFCEVDNVEYEKILGYCKTRWLVLMPAIERIYKMFQPLKSYILTLPLCPEILKGFFNNPYAEIWLFFLHNQSSQFNDTVLKVEGQNTTITQVSVVLRDLKLSLASKIKDRFVPQTIKSMVKNSRSEKAEKTSRVPWITECIVKFYENCFSYLTEWSSHYTEFESLVWADLSHIPSWAIVEKSLPMLSSKLKRNGSIEINDSQLYDEMLQILSFVTQDKLNNWRVEHVEPSKRWTEIFVYFDEHQVPYPNILIIIQYIFALAGSNAATERIFSLMNQLWTSEKTNLDVQTVKSMLITKFNFSMTCAEFYEFLAQEKTLLRLIHGSEKYN